VLLWLDMDMNDIGNVAVETAVYQV
jgi:hypothetical protein